MDVSDFTTDQAKMFLFGLEMMPEILNNPETQKLISQCNEIILTSGEYASGEDWNKNSEVRKWAQSIPSLKDSK